jgi:hypothetical protein
MKDSLSLSTAQRIEIYKLNTQIGQAKAAVWKKYDGNEELIRVHLQQIEDKRDSLYRVVLGEEKFNLYREKKRFLLNNN